MENRQDEWAITISFELKNITIEQIENDNEINNFSRCYPVDADSCRVYD